MSYSGTCIFFFLVYYKFTNKKSGRLWARALSDSPKHSMTSSMMSCTSGSLRASTVPASMERRTSRAEDVYKRQLDILHLEAALVVGEVGPGQDLAGKVHQLGAAGVGDIQRDLGAGVQLAAGGRVGGDGGALLDVLGTNT